MAQLTSIGALIDSAWDHYRKHFITLIKINAWVLLVIALNIVALFFYPLNAQELTRSLTRLEIFGVVLFVLSNLVVAVVINIWIMNALIGAVHNQLENKRVQMNTLTKRAWQQFGPMLLLIVELGLIYGVSLLIPLGVYWFLTTVVASVLPIGALLALLFLGLLLFIPPFALMVYLSFARFSLVSGGLRGAAAIKESANLVRGRFWPVLWRLAIPKIIYFIVLALAQFLLLTVFSVLTIGSGQEQTALGLIATPTTWYLLLIFINPLLIVTDQLIYRDLKRG